MGDEEKGDFSWKIEVSKLALRQGPWAVAAYLLWGQFTGYLDFNKAEMKQQTTSLEVLTDLQKTTINKLDKIEERQKETTGAVRATMP